MEYTGVLIKKKKNEVIEFFLFILLITAHENQKSSVAKY